MARNTPEINVQRIVDEVRERVRYRQSLAGQLLAAPLPFLPLDGSLVEDLKRLTYNWDLYETPLPPGKGLKGRPLSLVRRLLRRLLAPMLWRQSAFNAAAMHVVAQLAEQLDVLASRHGDLLEDVMLQHAKATEALRDDVRHGLAEQASGLGNALATLRTEIAGVRNEVTNVTATAADAAAQQANGLRERIARVERAMRRLTDATEPTSMAPSATATDETTMPSAFDYAGFEERFRGSEDTIRERQRAYVPLFDGSERVLDLGCGRGEFLELLRAADVRAAGVDGDLDMVLACREKGLDVAHDDLFAFLERQPDGSLGGLFAAQVIEHLPPPKIIDLVTTALRKLAPGAPLVLETPNPACLSIFAASFYMDFSHLRPIHPDAMRFVLEAAGYDHVELRFSSPVEQAVRFPPLPDTVAGPEFAARFNRAIDHTNALLYGCQDYAVIGRRRVARSTAAVA